MTPTSATPTSVTPASVTPVASPSAVAACNADARSVETAVQAYDAVNGSWPSSPSQLVGPSSYFRTWPGNPSLYTISLGADGAVDVAPAAGTPGYRLGSQNYDTYVVRGVGNICATV